MPKPPLHWVFPIGFIWDYYWCFIPLKCRDCKWLTQCRKPFLQGRKCYNGCIELNILREQKKEREHEEHLNSLVDYYEKQEQQNKHK